ncbi:hypothetical protein Tco_0428912 [Tanacetum coccineum]
MVVVILYLNLSQDAETLTSRPRDNRYHNLVSRSVTLDVRRKPIEFHVDKLVMFKVIALDKERFDGEHSTKKLDDSTAGEAVTTADDDSVVPITN